MPKEIIRDEAGMFDMVVGWTHGQSAQVGIQTSDGRSLADVLRGGAAVEGQPPQEDPAEFRSLWGTLDRAGINRMIAVLRRARDQAYGKDE